MTANLTTDSWFNPVTGVGGIADKTAGFTFNPIAYRAWDYPQLLEALYESDELAAIKVDAIVDDAFAKGWTVEASGLTPKQVEAVIDFNDRLKITKHVVDARKWSRLFGGGAVHIGYNDAEQKFPITLGMGELLFAQAYERDELYPSRWYDNPLSPKFGRPSHYRLSPYSVALTGGQASGAGEDIHESRFLLFYGAETTKRRRTENLGWGSSVLLRPMTALKQFNGAYALVLSLLADANQNIYKLKGFADLTLAGRGDAIEERIKLIDQFRSAVKALIVDADSEDFVRSQLSLSGIDGILTSYKERLAAAFEMPLTRLLGVSPAGLNATGESDERNWHKQVLSEQEDVLRPQLERWLRVAFSARNGPTGGVTPDSFKVKFPPLRDVTPKEQAEIDSINAQTDQIYRDMGALKVPQIAKARFSAEPTRPVLTPEDIAALELDVKLTEPPDPTLTEQTEPPLDGVADTEDALGEESPPPVDTDLMTFVANMNRFSAPSCRHGSTNRCRVCGIERVPTVAMDAAGVITYPLKWRPIGVTTDSLDAYNSSQPRQDDGKFGEGSGGSSGGGESKSSKLGSKERRSSVKEHVTKAHAADKARVEKSKARLEAAKVERKALAKAEERTEKELHKSLGPEKVQKLDELDSVKRRTRELSERISDAENGRPAYSPEAQAVHRDLPAAKTKLTELNAHSAKLQADIGDETPEQNALRKEHAKMLVDLDDLDNEISHHDGIVKGAAKREKAFSALNDAVDSGDRNAIGKAQQKLADLLGDSDDSIFDDESFSALNPDEHDIGSTVFGEED